MKEEIVLLWNFIKFHYRNSQSINKFDNKLLEFPEEIFSILVEEKITEEERKLKFRNLWKKLFKKHSYLKHSIGKNIMKSSKFDFDQFYKMMKSDVSDFYYWYELNLEIEELENNIDDNNSNSKELLEKIQLRSEKFIFSFNEKLVYSILLEFWASNYYTSIGVNGYHIISKYREYSSYENSKEIEFCEEKKFEEEQEYIKKIKFINKISGILFFFLTLSFMIKSITSFSSQEEKKKKKYMNYMYLGILFAVLHQFSDWLFQYK